MQSEDQLKQREMTMRNQFREVLSAQKHFFIIIPILMIAIILSFSLIVSVYYTAQSFSHVSYSDGYAIYDAYGVETVSKLFSDETAMNEELKKQKLLYADFRNAWGEDYYVMTEQPVYIETPFGDKFAYGYDPYEADEYSEYFINCYQMNSAAIKGSPMKLHSGRWFKEDEYVVTNNIPVIVGNNYKEHLNLGDSLSIKYLNKDFNATVVGILEEHSYTARDEYTPLENYLVIPAMEYNLKITDKEESSFELKMYLHHTNGFIHTDKNVLAVEEQLEEICKAYGIKEYFLSGVPYGIRLFDWGIAKSIRFILIASITLFVMFAVLLSYLSHRKSREVIVENKKSFILAKYIESLIMVAITGLICFPFAIITSSFIGIQWWILVIVLGFIFLILPIISLIPKRRMQ